MRSAIGLPKIRVKKRFSGPNAKYLPCIVDKCLAGSRPEIANQHHCRMKVAANLVNDSMGLSRIGCSKALFGSAGRIHHLITAGTLTMGSSLNPVMVTAPYRVRAAPARSLSVHGTGSLSLMKTDLVDAQLTASSRAASAPPYRARRKRHGLPLFGPAAACVDCQLAAPMETS